MLSQLIEPSSSRTILEKSRVKASYLDFWNQIKNNPNLLPLYSPDIIEDLFDRASEIVARIRILLNRQNPSAHILRNSCGQSKEKLWHGQITEKQITSPEEFVRDLVHTSLQDVHKKYIHGLTAEKVDEYIKTIEEFLNQNRSSQGKEILSQFIEDAQDIVTQLQKIDLSKDSWKSYALFLNLKKLGSDGASLKHKVHSLLSAQEQLTQQNERKTSQITEDKESDSPAQSSEDSGTSQTPEDSESESEGNRTPTQTRKKYEIKINQVADDVSLLRGKVQHLSEVAEKLNLSELAKDPKEGTKAVNDLQKKCLEYTEHLMKNLLSLDEIIGSTSTRSQKKQQINSIQELMSDMDSVNDRLKKLSQTLKAEAEAEEKENEKKRKLLVKEEQEAKKKKIEEDKSKTSQPINKIQPKKQEEEEEESEEEAEEEEGEDVEDEDEEEDRRLPEKVWKSLQFDANLDVREFHDRFVIVGQLPGVRKQNLTVDLSPNQTLVISGFRLPTEKEEDLMRKHANVAWLRNHQRRPRNISKQEEDRLVLEMAKGRYGTFRESYRLPGNIDKQRISASLEKGILQVIIPKIRAPVGGPFHNDYFW